MSIDTLDRSVTEAVRAWRVQHSAGLDISTTLISCGTLCSDPAAQSCFQQAAQRAGNGDGIVGMLNAMKPILSEAERAVIAAGWQSGRVEPVLDAVVTQRELWASARSKIRSQLVLPGLILCLAAFVAPLPQLIAGSGGVGDYLFNALLPLGAAFLVWRIFEGTVAARNAKLDALLLELPLISSVEKNRNLSEFASVLSILISAGSGISNALEICARSASNSVYANDIQRCAAIVQKGNPLSTAMHAGKLWPQQFINMIQVGEKAGSLDSMLHKMGESYRDDYTRAIEAMAAWIPRLLYAMVAVFVIIQIARLVGSLAGAYSSIGH